MAPSNGAPSTATSARPTSESCGRRAKVRRPAKRGTASASTWPTGRSSGGRSLGDTAGRLSAPGVWDDAPRMSGENTGVALVTGAASGIGAAVSRRLAEHGWKVAGIDLQSVGRPTSRFRST